MRKDINLIELREAIGEEGIKDREHDRQKNHRAKQRGGEDGCHRFWVACICC